ncbi:MAG: preprotein translocase subunit SecA [Acholeplasmataceae bacterium]|jgi:preprotein translocase subunit SecA|nr:preprotein translocase subunit SecA [Acholeplasmataceae bacterium]
MLKKWFDPSKKELKLGKLVAEKVFSLETEMAQLSDDEVKLKTESFKKRYQEGESLESIMPEAFALVREASKRITKLVPYFVQVQGAVAIFHGNIAEMKTGEGKTLTAVMPAYLSALNGEGVHIVTVNEYLAKREAEGDIGDLFRFLGLTVGLNLRDITREQKRAAYDCDIMYSTNSELGFDYLRDHMVLFAKDMVAQRGLNYAIIDEVDSILIDEARTPLIISGGQKNNYNLYTSADRFAKSLRDEDFEIDIESKSIALTPSGIKKAEQIFQLDNLYDLKYVTLVHHINNALRSNYIMARDKEYVVDGGEVLIVDQFTGRILRGRQFSEGLHQALEAKEGVEIKKETVTVATITYQNFFRMYKKLSGMTGTAKTEEEEFRDIYNMDVIEIPTNAPVIRKDEPDYIYANLKDKFESLCDEIEQRHKKGQPLLIGTIAVETSEDLSRMLSQRRIPHEVLNAKNHEREAEIVAKAGLKGAVTIATNMAGRGTDIKLGEGVVELGGLAVLGSERHESRRIDNQLRGRAGRQGDPGYSRFYLSAEDELMQRFGGDSFKRRIELLERLNTSSEPLSSKLFSRFVTSAQKRIEGNNFDMRKNVLKYDNVLRKQREIIYKERRDVLTLDSIEDQVVETIQNSLKSLVNQFIHQVGKNEFDIDDDNIIAQLNGNIFQPETFTKEILEQFDEVEIVNFVIEQAMNELKRKKELVPIEIYNEFLKVIMLRIIDTHWMRHIDTMSELRQAVSLQAYAQQSPLVIYQKDGLRLFNEMIQSIARDVTRYAIRGQINYNVEREAVVKNTQTNEGRTDSRPKKPKIKKNRAQRNLPWR